MALLEVLLGGVVLLEENVDGAAIHVGAGVVGLHGDGLAERGQRVVIVLLRQQHVAQQDVAVADCWDRDRRRSGPALRRWSRSADPRPDTFRRAPTRALKWLGSSSTVWLISRKASWLLLLASGRRGPADNGPRRTWDRSGWPSGTGWTAESYFSWSMYFMPLSRYFFLATSGFLLQPTRARASSGRYDRKRCSDSA